MRILIALFLISFTCFASDERSNTKINFQKKILKSSGDFNNSEYRIKLFEPDHKNYMWYFGGTVDKDYDNFGKIIRLSGYTNIGIEF